MMLRSALLSGVLTIVMSVQCRAQVNSSAGRV
jgi:hypothetical protein